MSTTYTVKRDGERLDTICHLWYGTLEGRVVERALDANPGLASLDPARLPAHTTIVMPPMPQRRQAGQRIF